MIEYAMALAQKIDRMLCRCGCRQRTHYVAVGLGCDEHGPHRFSLYRPLDEGPWV